MDASSELTAHASRLNHVFLTNELPSETEAVEIRRILDLANDELIVLEAGGPREMLETLATKCRVALSCVRRVPPELVSEIFAMCVPSGVDDDQSWNTLDIACVPWVLARVSSSWRAVAISQPELWAYIKIDLEEMEQNGQIEPPLAMLQTSLERSGSVLLRVFFHDSYRPTDRAQEMLTSLMSHSHRWNQLSLFVSYPHLHLTNQIRGRLPLLQYLNIGAYGANTFAPFDGFELAPMLRHVFLKDEWETVILPWAQLTTLDGETVVSPGPVIRRCPELLRCHFDFPRGPFSRIFEPITRHEKLQYLEMNVVGVLSDMVLPSLQELHISSRALFARNLQLLADFFRLSGSSLRVFTWQSATIIDPATFTTIMENIPNLVHLEIGVPSRAPWSMKANIFMPLTITPSSRVLPKLESVTIRFDSTDVIIQPVIGPFLDMVESRWFDDGRQNIVRLREAKITKLRFREYDSPPVRSRIETLLYQGLLLVYDDESL